jgi:polysaccharide biosynthesis protein PslG
VSRFRRLVTLSALGGLALFACQQPPVPQPTPAAVAPTTPTTAPAVTPTTPPTTAPTVVSTTPPTATPAAAPEPPRTAAYRAQSPEYGLSAFLMGHADTTQRDLKKITDLRFGWVKLLFRWRDIEGDRKGRFDWGEADRVVKAARAANLRIIARLDFQPDWARRDGAHNGPPNDYSNYADYVRAFVNRYKQGSPNGTVDAIEIWNEVNLDREWGGAKINQGTAADYVRLLKESYQVAKRTDPGVTVISAGLSPTGLDDGTAQPDDVYLRWMYEAGAKPYFDVLAAHANVQCPCVDAAPASVEGFKHPSFYFRRVEQLREIMVANGDADKQIWLLEFGWTTDTVHPAYSWYATTEDKKSELIVQAFEFARQKWAPWIGVMTLWTIADPSWGPEDEQVWWSITNPDGSPRPAYDRLLRARNDGTLP